MAITTEYKCDRCEKVVEDGEKMRYIGIGTKTLRYNYGPPTIEKQQLWCIQCLVKAGAVSPSHDKKTEPEAPAPTLEDFIRDIAREEAEGVVENRR